MVQLHPQYITDSAGQRVSVVLPMAEYEELLDQLQDLEDADEARETLQRIERGEEETTPWENIKAAHGL